jgi:tRNA threonylcarbamoyladenosine biosynthesis protein TsaB
MALILNIDTATENATISICENDKVIDYLSNVHQKDHASFLQPAIKNLLEKAGLSINKLDAVAVSAGPGSYTGLRVGMASAKGLCYALNIPFITISSLQIMALSSANQMKEQAALYCPMIDARRMEVFTAIYDYDLSEIIQPCSMILDDENFKVILEKNKIYFSGSGILKLKEILHNENAFFNDSSISHHAQAHLAYEYYGKKNFDNIYSSSPVYLKEFYTLFKPE